MAEFWLTKAYLCTCFATKLEKHLKICNAREQELPDYIIHNINAPSGDGNCPRLPLHEISLDKILNVVDKINNLFEEYVQGKIETLAEKPIHGAVIDEFNEVGREESSLRHLRQVSRLLHIMEDEGLVQPNTCYVELGAGKGKLAAMAWRAWCEGKEDEGGSVLLVERASLRHKRDNGTAAARLRADLAHLALGAVPAVRTAAAVVAFAKHLCGVATEYGLYSVCGTGGALQKTRGLVLATCCHHRAMELSARPLQKFGITEEDLNVMLGVVSWATCGDGRSRERRRQILHSDQTFPNDQEHIHTENQHTDSTNQQKFGAKHLNLDREGREEVGRRAKALIDWGRTIYLKDHGFDAKLVYYVPKTVSLENVCIVAKKMI